MVWCSQCAEDVVVEADERNGFSCCVQCGRVVEDTAFASDVMFAKGGDGDGEMVGQMVGSSGEARGMGRYSGGRMWGGGGDSHEAAVSRGRHEIVALVEALRISPSSEATEAAHRLYRLALQRGFTRGRRVNQVGAVCLYIFCRLERRPYMLIDFSDHLSINVYALGGVFLQMLRLLRLDEHATFTQPIDPSLFLNRFVDRLRLPTQELKTKVGHTAMRLVQSMKRDWMLTGRRPSGICGAALFLAAHIHGVEKTKKDVISIVHIGWSTVEKRVMELAETRDAGLTLRELGERDRVMEDQREQMLIDYERAAAENPQQQPALLTAAASAAAGEDGTVGDEGSGALVEVDPNAAGRNCEHVRAGAPLLAHGMCRGCLEDYLKITLAVQEGAADPPAYLRNLRRDVRKRVRDQMAAGRSELLIRNGSDELLALEGPPGSGAGGEEELDIHTRRHLENEAALEDDFRGAPGGEPAAAGAGATAGTSAGPSAPRAAPDHAAAAGPSTGAYGGDSPGPGPSSGGGAGMHRSGSAALGGGGGVADEEEDAFDEALHSNELQPLAKALGGEAAAVATAPLQPRRPEAKAGAGGEEAAGARVDDGGAACGSGWRLGSGASPGAGPSGQRAAMEEQDGSEWQLAATKRLRLGGPLGVDGGSGLTGVDIDAGGDITAAVEDLLGGGGAGAGVVAEAGDGGEGGPVDSDNLSDVDDAEISGYLATREEASMRESLWVEMNKEWIEKQEAKKAAEAAAAADPNKQAAERAKRKYSRKPKAELPAAEDAAAAARNVLEARKLSNKINYGALEDLFGSAGAGGGGDDGGGGAGAGGSGARGRRSASPDYGGRGGGGREAYGGGARGQPAPADDADAGARPGVAAALAKRAVDRARTQAADADRYTAALEEEQRRRGGGSGGGGAGGLGGGGFLDSLTFARGGGEGAGGRARPAGLSLKPRGRL